MLVWIAQWLHTLWRDLANRSPSHARARLAPAPIARRIARRPLRRRVIEH